MRRGVWVSCLHRGVGFVPPPYNSTTGIRHVFVPTRIKIELVYPVLSATNVSGNIARLEKRSVLAVRIELTVSVLTVVRVLTASVLIATLSAVSVLAVSVESLIVLTVALIVVNVLVSIVDFEMRVLTVAASPRIVLTVNVLTSSVLKNP